MAQTVLKHIALSDIVPPDEGLRKVNLEGEKFMGMVESVRLKGIMNPINVRELPTGKYGLVDGLHRFTSASFAGLTTIPAQVIECSDAELMEAQIIANLHKVEVHPVEYSRGLLTILQSNPLLTRAELSAKLAKTTSWLSERLGLLDLEESIGTMVDADQIGLSNAYSLAKLDPVEQLEFVDRAISMPPAQFMATVNGRVKEIRDAKRQGRDPKAAEFQPVAVIRSRAELVEESINKTQASLLTVKFNINDPVSAFQLGIQWAIKMDPDSVLVQVAKDAERKAEKARINAEKDVERRDKRAKEAVAKAAKLAEDAAAAIAAKIAAHALV